MEIFERQTRGLTKSTVYKLNELKSLKKDIKSTVNSDLKKITSMRKNLCGIDFNKPQIMGVLNITPDSFSDGGLFMKKSKALDHVSLMINSGASIIDIGGESTRPGSKTINASNEWSRLKVIIKKIKKKFPKAIISLDTRKSFVMEKGISEGINIRNDVSGLNYDKKSSNVIGNNKIPFILHHMQGTPNTMQINPKYDDALLDIYDFFEKKLKDIKSFGIKHNNIILDPGIGFGKNLKHNITLIDKISIFHSLGLPIMLGISRKKFIKDLSKKNDSKERIGGTVASSLYSMMQGVQILRVHDVNEIIQSIKTFKKLLDRNL